MVSTIVSLLVLVLVLCVAWWAVTRMAAAFGLPEQITVVMQIIVVVLGLVAALHYLPGV